MRFDRGVTLDTGEARVKLEARDDTEPGLGIVYIAPSSMTGDDVFGGSLYMNRREYFRTLLGVHRLLEMQGEQEGKCRTHA